jgi:hypothetical protein
MAAETGPFTNEGARFGLVKTLCAVAEGAAAAVTRGDASCAVSAALHDAPRRFAMLGGRADMPRSIGSVYAGWTVLFLGATFLNSSTRDEFCRVDTFESEWTSTAVTCDGATLLRSYRYCIRVFRVFDGLLLQTIGCTGDGPLQFKNVGQMYCTADDFVFIADAGNARIQVLTPHLHFHSFVGVGVLVDPCGVCANTEVVAVSESIPGCICVFQRRGGAFLRRFGPLDHPTALCFLAAQRHVAVADRGNDRVAVFTLEGVYVRHVDTHDLSLHVSVDIVSSDFEELAVLNARGVTVFTPSGRIARFISPKRNEDFDSVALRGRSIFVAAYRDARFSAVHVYE